VLRAVVLTQYRRVTDGRTDGIAVDSTALAMRALRRGVKMKGLEYVLTTASVNELQITKRRISSIEATPLQCHITMQTDSRQRGHNVVHGQRRGRPSSVHFIRPSPPYLPTASVLFPLSTTTRPPCASTEATSGIKTHRLS